MNEIFTMLVMIVFIIGANSILFVINKQLEKRLEKKERDDERNKPM